MSATGIAVVLSLVSAVAYAAAAVAQERLASRARADRTGLLRLLGSAAWWGSVALNAAGAALHVAALRFGPLTLVQPLGALTLVAAVPLGAHRAGRRVSRAERRGTSATLVGLGALLTATSAAAPQDTLGARQALGVAAVSAVLIAVLARPGARPGLRHAAASGLASGVASALTQTVTVALTGGGAGPVPRVLLVALLVAAFAGAGLLLAQTAYRDGLGAPLAVVTLANPVAAAVIGLTLLGERLQGGAAGAVSAVAGAALAARGVVLLTRRPDTPGAPAPPSGAVAAGPVEPAGPRVPGPAGCRPPGARARPTTRPARPRHACRTGRICELPAAPSEIEDDGTRGPRAGTTPAARPPQGIPPAPCNR
ncbi:DMT family transporter [Streptomyces sp. P1-3]|uniref:DMT family transporter n=1 Tax=Streptomyces sp. P1-3 TaxID=3421658 RepID=UPI003D35FBC6